jgi:hypothetical protein
MKDDGKRVFALEKSGGDKCGRKKSEIEEGREWF